uniref:Ribonuclease H-like domain-containing protein n=1 Tax=Tanacetum cinerariifolium TaxID=118510 RepID=A0A6L2NMX9_TANCI|nr:ribonuclease H-like domain-containing protein [Tanacetum cinerariifolium]
MDKAFEVHPDGTRCIKNQSWLPLFVILAIGRGTSGSPYGSWSIIMCTMNKLATITIGHEASIAWTWAGAAWAGTTFNWAEARVEAPMVLGLLSCSIPSGPICCWHNLVSNSPTHVVSLRPCPILWSTFVSDIGFSCYCSSSNILYHDSLRSWMEYGYESLFTLSEQHRHKYHADGSLSRYKARLIANGRSQQQEIDYDETFSPIVKSATIRIVLSLVAEDYLAETPRKKLKEPRSLMENSPCKEEITRYKKATEEAYVRSRLFEQFGEYVPGLVVPVYRRMCVVLILVWASGELGMWWTRLWVRRLDIYRFGPKSLEITLIVPVVVHFELTSPLTATPSKIPLTFLHVEGMYVRQSQSPQPKNTDGIVQVQEVEEKPVRIILGPLGIVQLAKICKQSDIYEGEDDSVLSTQEYTKQVVEDVGEDDNFNSGSWVGATEYVKANGGIVSRCIGDIKTILKNELEQVVAIIKSCSLNALGDLNVTIKDLFDTLQIFSPNLSMHYLNITKKNVVKVFYKDFVPGNGSGVGGSGMLMEEEEIVELVEEEEMADLETLSRYKARLVANDSSRQLGVDFDETFSPVVKRPFIRTVLSLAVSRQWHIYQLDVKNAFLNGDLSETVYMHQPPGFVNPWEPHFAALKRILHYVQGTLELGLHLYASATTSVVGCTDADWACCPSTHSGISGCCYVVAKTAWIRNLIRELHSPLLTATLVYYDNISVVYMSANPIQHHRTKHIDIDIHFVHDMVKVVHVRVLYVPSRFQYADIFTKDSFGFLVDKSSSFVVSGRSSVSFPSYVLDAYEEYLSSNARNIYICLGSGLGTGTLVEPLFVVPSNDELQQAIASVAKAEADVLLEITHKILMCWSALVTNIEKRQKAMKDVSDARARRKVNNSILTGPVCAIFLFCEGLYVLSSKPMMMTWFDFIFVDIVDEQSLSQSLSTFYGHLKQTCPSFTLHLFLKPDSRDKICFYCSGSGTGTRVEPLSTIPLNDELQQARATVAKVAADVILEITHKMQTDLDVVSCRSSVTP